MAYKSLHEQALHLPIWMSRNAIRLSLMHRKLWHMGLHHPAQDHNCHIQERTQLSQLIPTKFFLNLTRVLRRNLLTLNQRALLNRPHLSQGQHQAQLHHNRDHHQMLSTCPVCPFQFHSSTNRHLHLYNSNLGATAHRSRRLRGSSPALYK
jgi:hypothetical protein